ncbi:molybdenum cofactor biosynthesis protein MoaE [Cryptosporangium sp. NPDC048952]|uniref:molybdenum cofactor biosynthesis protein MoaE n=1 Tax=Cryptosporangium sp. NPDC048952 TaxID=3363961 RepID=UPI0037188A62
MSSETIRRAGHRVVVAQVTESPISVAEHEQAVADLAAGAVVGFAGVVRDHDHGRSVAELEYTGHPSAGEVIEQIAAEFAERDGVEAIAVSHRIGPLRLGDTALACAVSTAHRAEAFALCAELVDAVKARIPIWKRQVFDDGSDEWVACP